MTGRIFINYRRDDDAGFVLALFQQLEAAFGAASVFMDVDNIPAGHDFVQVLRDEVGRCDVLLAAIGRQWLDARDEAGNRRLDNPDDFVRIEIVSALQSGKRVIPVLVNNAEMPRPADLPEPLKALSRRNAVRLSRDRFRADAQGLVKVLHEALQEAEAARAAKTEAERLAAEDAQRRKQEEEEARATEAARLAEQRARQQAAAGLSAEEIRKAEELANWDFIKQRLDAAELRDHLARFSGGVTERYARTALEDIVWKALGNTPGLAALESYLGEFPAGANAAKATAQRDALRRETEARQAEEAARRRETDAWAKASSEDTKAAYDEFLAAHPRSEHVKAARYRIREIERPATRGGLSPAWVIGVLLVLAAATSSIVYRNLNVLSDWRTARSAAQAPSLGAIASSPDPTVKPSIAPVENARPDWVGRACAGVDGQGSAAAKAKFTAGRATVLTMYTCELRKDLDCFVACLNAQECVGVAPPQGRSCRLFSQDNVVTQTAGGFLVFKKTQSR